MTAVLDTSEATALWVRNRSDELAVANGCTFDAERSATVVWWIERHCRLYEGEWAGESLILRGCHECGTYDLPASDAYAAFEGEAVEVGLERAHRYAECVVAGHPLDWQYECTMRFFGWVRHSAKWQRHIRRFRQASIWVPKKNKKSPSLAAWSMYLMCGDGEPGQKIFLAAKDGQQARKIAGEHARQMLLQSPVLMSECKLNENLMRLSHLPSRSYLEPLSSSNSRTQESKEGLNGSVMVDETHVVDGDFMRRISRAGISRSEPVQAEFSTAGNNPDSYGKQRFDYAQRVERGDATDEQLFVAIYAAPQDLSDADLDADPLKWGRFANPAMGHTVDPDELLQDYRRSKGSIQALLDFKMYRLNIWQRTSNPWIKGSDWEACRRQFTTEDLRGRPCYAALDLARSRDMSALVLVFPWPEDGEEACRLLPYFWLPKDRVQELQTQVPDILSWERSGHLFVTPGGVTDYGYIRATFRELHQQFNIRELVYDPKFAEETTQNLEQGVTDNKGAVIEAGTGVPRTVFVQDDASFAAPVLDFERAVIAGTLHHNGHPVLTWQVGHAHVIVKPSKVKRVVKPSRSPADPRTIDGVVAAVMGRGRAAMRVGEQQWYSSGCLKD